MNSTVSGYRLFSWISLLYSWVTYAKRWRKRFTCYNRKCSLCSANNLTFTNIRHGIKWKQKEHERQQDRSKRYADGKDRTSPEYKIANKVLATIHELSKAQQGYISNFAPKRDGPYVVCKQFSHSSYQGASLATPDILISVYHISAFTSLVYVRYVFSCIFDIHL